ncbi:putative vacuolar calcium ion transporter protein [Golovinomyces cichoracearum]|uniref:Putative vacuolar calcium ion transporter protein n=1 Tax=Golovinomyces cichoracearum TaxID=62708 RepID=A0A420IN29_9PEZI|nr:putative vacuolar calcium ion transporter protein [Golovinomyces cichoracearum]
MPGHIRFWTTSKAQDSPNLHTNISTDRSIPTDTQVKDEKSQPQDSSVHHNEESVNEFEEKSEKKNIFSHFYQICKSILFSSFLNLFLIFVPAGIIAKFTNLDPGIIFGLNALAILPLAGMLSYATETAAQRMGDTIGALINVTFGNAVELIIFIALQKGQLRIVQASILGSILANLLLILGMCFLIGGLKYREQLYNSNVTQLTACLLSLSVMSLLLPTAFYASFSKPLEDKATSAVLKVSRGTSVVLLIVYGMYLLFQLKSHAYMYQSTPQHMIDEELAPGPVAAWIEHASVNQSFSTTDSDVSGLSHFTTTTRRVKKIIRRRSTRPSRCSHSSGQFSLKNSLDLQPRLSHDTMGHSPRDLNFCPSIYVNDVSMGPEEVQMPSPTNFRKVSIFDDNEKNKGPAKVKRKFSKQKLHIPKNETPGVFLDNKAESPRSERGKESALTKTALVSNDSVMANNKNKETSESKRPFDLRLLGFPTISKSLAPNVFSQPYLEPTGTTDNTIPNVRYGIHFTNSLPNNLQPLQQVGNRIDPRINLAPAQLNAADASHSYNPPEHHKNMSYTSSILLLLISTVLVAICAEFMVGSIDAVVKNDTGISEAFIGLIILPIVGNAAEHVTAVTVAVKNKMDLAIGVALGSSIQISLFVTPFAVLLGWCMNRDLSLYFTLFETVSLFVSAFIVNFLVLDGRSNYLEGALLCSAYIMIAVAAFFYPSVQESSNLGGNSASDEIAKRAIDFVFRIT